VSLSTPSDAGTPPPGFMDIPGGWAERTVQIANYTFDLVAPADPVEFLHQLDESSAAHVADPYWSAIWSAAPALAQRVARHAWSSGTRALELGCGVGLVGLAALASGVSVTFSDYIPTAVELARENARRNGFSAAGLHLDWRDPPTINPFPLVLASDVLYETQMHADLLSTLDRVLSDDGECWIGDPLRMAATEFATLALSRGYHVTLDRANPEGISASDQENFQMLVLRRQILRRQEVAG